jgi:hypothetical protein
MPETSLLAAHRKGRGAEDSASPAPTIGPGILWHRMPTYWRRMPGGSDHKTLGPLRMQIRCWNPDERHHRTPSLQESFSNYGRWVADTWLKSVWEKVSKFNITIKIAPLPINPPREGDQWFMKAVVAAGVYEARELIRINRFRCHQQVLFLSDILDAGGRAIDKPYLERRIPTANWSTLIFPLEQPPRRDLSLWQQALYSLAPRGRVDRRIDGFLTKGHKIWEWRYDEEAQRVYHLKGNVMDIYTPSAVPRLTRRRNCWTRSRIDVPALDTSEICSVRKEALAVYSVVSSCASAPSIAPLTNLWSAIESWGNTLLWDNLKIRGDISWLAESTADNSIVAVTDGSYMKDTHPTLT